MATIKSLAPSQFNMCPKAGTVRTGFHRATMAVKCDGLDDEQAATASVPPSGFTLTGLVQHLAEVERNWFRRVLTGEQIPAIYDPHVSLRWIFVHMIEEYARHNGHADLLRECIDGVTGD